MKTPPPSSVNRRLTIWKPAVWAALHGIIIAGVGLNAPGATLAQNGKSDYQIVISRHAIASEKYAAEELQHYLEGISGAKLPIVDETAAPLTHEIWLGESERLRLLKRPVDFENLGAEGYALWTEGDNLVIAGGKPRGTLYGVYSFLEDDLGVRWFTPEVETVPKKDTLELPKLDKTYIPPLTYRDASWTELMRDPNFAARHRLNGQFYALTEKHGGRPQVYYPFVHSMEELIPRSLYAEHPDYFPLVDGKRIDGYVQRCLSNPDVVKMGIARVREWIKAHPEATIISVSQNDTANYCQCDQCKALDDAEGSHSATMLRFVNEIAADIEHDYPSIRIDTLAYQYTRKPPKTVRPRKNVLIRLCSIECCFAHPLDTCASPANRAFRDDIADWGADGATMYIWDYTPNYAHFEQPFPNFDSLQPNIRFFIGHGVKGLFEEGNSSRGGYGELGPLRSYLIAELLWNPDTDVKRATGEFLSAYYKKAAPAIYGYVNLLESQVREKPIHAGIYDPPTAPYLNADFINGAERLFAEATRLADDDAIRFRVEVAHLPVWYVELATNRVTGDQHKELLERFLKVARKAGITEIREGGSLDDWAKAQGTK